MIFGSLKYLSPKNLMTKVNRNSSQTYSRRKMISTNNELDERKTTKSNTNKLFKHIKESDAAAMYH